MATPFTADRDLDLDGAQRLATHLVEHGSDGLVVAGTTGESPTLSHDETLDLFSAVVEAVGERTAVVAGVGKNDTAATVRLAEEAAGLGVDGLLVVTPYYNRPSQRGLIAHFTAVARAVEQPILLYNIPSRTACEIAPETLLAIHEAAPSVRAVKDAVKDLDKAAWVNANAPDTFEIYAGNDIDLLPLLAVGAVGIVSVAGHLVGERLAALIASFPTDPAAARAHHLALLPLFSALFVDTNPVPLKAALRQLRLPGGPVRPPLADAEEEVEGVVADALAAVGVTA
jgi:4-hydroxy-tetrahydrodipicolinate synthase